MMRVVMVMMMIMMIIIKLGGILQCDDSK